MNKYLRELIWLISPIILSLIFVFTLYGFADNDEAVLDINVHDTYHVLPRNSIIIILSVLFIVLSYMVRLLYKFRRNKIIAILTLTINVILISACILVVISVAGLFLY